MKTKNLIQKLSLLICILFMVQFVGAGWASAQQTATTDIVERAKTLMQVTERIRGLDFLYDIPVDLVSQDEIMDIINEQLDMELDSEQDRIYTALYAILGLVTPGSSLRADYQTMAEEQVAGLYDQHEKRFYVVDIDMGDMLSKMLGDSGALGSFLGGFLEGMIDPETEMLMTDTVIIHELTHALDDQHFDLEGTLAELVEGNSDDAQLAYQSLVEGNATRTMNQYAMEQSGMDASMMDTMSQLNMTFAEMFMDYNPFLERIMLAPYLNGEVFVNYIISREGDEGLNRLFIDPPESMEQILHPERFTPNRDVPSAADPPDLSAALPDWEQELTDTLGELIISVMFELQTGDRARSEIIAEGWDYDVATTWRSPGNDLALAWVTVWDDENEAREFFDEYCDILEIMHPSGSWNQRDSDYALYTGMGLAAVVKQEYRTVVIVEGVPVSDADDCIEAAMPASVIYR